jgi:hypothetical protein
MPDPEEMREVSEGLAYEEYWERSPANPGEREDDEEEPPEDDDRESL